MAVSCSRDDRSKIFRRSITRAQNGSEEWQRSRFAKIESSAWVQHIGEDASRLEAGTEAEMKYIVGRLLAPKGQRVQ